MRSYVLHPYQMVKDLRTEHESGNPTSVFDGEIDDFLESGIRWRRTREARRLTAGSVGALGRPVGVRCVSGGCLPLALDPRVRSPDPLSTEGP